MCHMCFLLSHAIIHTFIEIDFITQTMYGINTN